MKRGALVLLCFFPAALLSGLGKSAEKTKTELNPEWTLCITQFDVSALTPSQAALGRVSTRNLVNHLNGLDFKLRSQDEYDYYWMASWLKGQSDAAKKIVEKQAQRDKLVFQGEPGWRVRSQMKNLDAEIKTLRADLEKVELNSPPVAQSPKFILTKENQTGTFPPPPEPGKEYYMCVSQKADALLMGRLSNFQGRIRLELTLWTVWARDISWKEDTMLFSVEDIDLALSELSARLMNSISGMIPATLMVRAKPDNAVIIVDDYHAGRGKSEELDRTPGPVTITVYAKNHITAKEKIELEEGESVEVDFELKELPTESFTVEAVREEGAKVYAGGYYAGTSPVTLVYPLDQTVPVNIETGMGNVAQTIFKVQSPETTLSLVPKTPPREGRTEKARKGFYGALGRFWIAAPAAFLLTGLTNIYIDSFNASPARRQQEYDTSQMWYNISTGAVVVLGLSFAEIFVRLGIYLYQGSKETPVIGKELPKEPPKKTKEKKSPAKKANTKVNTKNAAAQQNEGAGNANEGEFAEETDLNGESRTGNE